MNQEFDFEYQFEPIVNVRVLLPDLRSHVLVDAQIDTGAAWSVLDPILAKTFGLLDQEGESALLHTRFGLIEGNLVRLPITFLPDQGDPLDTYGTFFISPDWPPGRTFLGYSGLLDSIRFALDPQANHFYFGPGI